MPGTVDDFMRRFGGGETVDDREAAQYHDRFVSTHDDDRDFDTKTYHEGATEYLGKLPDDQFHEAAKNAVAQAPDKNRQGLLGGLMSAHRRWRWSNRHRRARERGGPWFDGPKQDERG